MGTLVTGVKEARQDQMAATAKMTVAINDLLDTNERLEAEIKQMVDARTRDKEWRAEHVYNWRARVAQLADALDEIDTGLADAIEFRHEGKEMATDFYEGLREVARKALDKHNAGKTNDSDST